MSYTPLFGRLGERIRFRIPAGRGRNGQKWAIKSGKIAMVFSDHVVVNGGGRYGTPYVVNDENWVPGKR